MNQDFSFVTSTGATGGLRASVLAIGVTPPPPSAVSALEAVLGGAGGFLAGGGGTNPGSLDPSPAYAAAAVARMMRKVFIAFR